MYFQLETLAGILVFSGHVHFEGLSGGGEDLADITLDPGGDDMFAFYVGLHGGVEAGGVAAAGAAPSLRLQADHHGADQVVQY